MVRLLSLAAPLNNPTGSPARIAVLLLALMVAASTTAPPAGALDAETLRAAHADLIHGRADEGIRLLSPALARNPGDADAHNLLCRIFLQEERWDDAIRHCEAATQQSSQSSDFHMWLGRAYGEKASQVSFVEAYRLARKVRSEFELAVKLDGRNVPALADLCEFYTEAPAIIGGGLDKAQQVADRVEPLDQARAHEMRGSIAEDRKDVMAAESEFKAEVAAAPNPAIAWTVLASFYRKQQHWDNMMQAIRNAVAADNEHGVASAYAASILIKSNREPQLAIHLLQAYLASDKQTEDMPAFLAHVHLGQLMDQQGDKQSAQREFQAARAMAHEYRGIP